MTAAVEVDRRELIRLVLGVESGGKRYGAKGSVAGPESLTESTAGALGEMQVMPTTITDPGYGIEPAADPKDPDEIARVGRDAISQWVNLNGVQGGIISYNWGPGHYDKWKARGEKFDELPKDTKDYLRIVGRHLGLDLVNTNPSVKTPLELEGAPKTGILRSDVELFTAAAEGESVSAAASRIERPLDFRYYQNWFRDFARDAAIKLWEQDIDPKDPRVARAIRDQYVKKLRARVQQDGGGAAEATAILRSQGFDIDVAELEAKEEALVRARAIEEYERSKAPGRRSRSSLVRALLGIRPSEEDMTSERLQKLVDGGGRRASAAKMELERRAQAGEEPIESGEQIIGLFNTLQHTLGPFHKVKDILITSQFGPNLNPFYQEDAAKLKRENPEEFWTKLNLQEIYGVKGFAHPGSTSLQSLGMPRWAADLISYDLLDPVGWGMGKPLTIALLGGIGAKAVGVPLTPFGLVKLLKSMRNARTVVEGVELADEAAKLKGAAAVGAKVEQEAMIQPGVTASMLDQDARLASEIAALRRIGQRSTQFAAKVTTSQEAATALKEQARAAGRAARSQEALAEASQTLARVKRAAGTKLRQIAAAEEDNARLVAKMDKPTAEDYVATRLQTVTSAEEMAVVQRLYQEKYKLPSSWFTKDQLMEQFYDHKTGNILNVPGNLLYDFVNNPLKYITRKGKFRTKAGKLTKDARALKAALSQGGDEVKDLFGPLVKRRGRQVTSLTGKSDELGPVIDRINSMAYLPRHPLMRQMRLGLEKMFKDGAPELSFLGNMLGRLRFGRHILQNTGVFDAIRTADQIRHTSIEKTMAQLIGIFDGAGIKHTAGHMGIMASAGEKLSLKSRGLLGIRGTSKELTEIHDRVAYLQGDDVFKEALDELRISEGLAPLESVGNALAGDIGKKAGQIQQRLQALWDDLAVEAQESGFLMPDQIITRYLPRLIKERRKTGDLSQAIRNLDNEFTNKGTGEAYPFFSMLRTGEAEISEFNLVNMVEAYARALYRHKYLRPALRDAAKVATSPGAKIGMADRKRILDYVMHTLGNVSGAQHAINSNISGLTDDLLKSRGGQQVLSDLRRGIEGIIDNPVESASAIRKMSRKMAGMYYLAWIGGAPALVARNLTQRVLGNRYLGTGLSRREKPFQGYLLKGRSRWKNDAALREEFAEVVEETGWVRNWIEFADEVVNGLDRKHFGKKLRDFLMFFYRWSDLDNRVSVYSGAAEYVDDLVKNAANGGNAWRQAARQMRPSDRALFTQAMEAGDLRAARKAYAKFAVEESQWLYHPRNRAMGFNTQNELVKAMTDTAYLFASWPINYAEAIVHSAKVGLGPGKVTGKFLTSPKQQAKAIGGALSYVMPLSIVGAATTWAGQQYGFDLGRWFSPDLPSSAKDFFGIDRDTKARVLPGLAPLAQLRGTVSEPVFLRLGKATARAASNIGAAAISDDVEVSGPAMRDFFGATPLPRSARLVARELARTLGLEDDPQFQNTAEKILAAGVDLRDDDTAFESLMRGFGFPLLPEDQR